MRSALMSSASPRARGYEELRLLESLREVRRMLDEKPLPADALDNVCRAKADEARALIENPPEDPRIHFDPRVAYASVLYWEFLAGGL